MHWKIGRPHSGHSHQSITGLTHIDPWAIRGSNKAEACGRKPTPEQLFLGFEVTGPASNTNTSSKNKVYDVKMISIQLLPPREGCSKSRRPWWSKAAAPVFNSKCWMWAPVEDETLQGQNVCRGRRNQTLIVISYERWFLIYLIYIKERSLKDDEWVLKKSPSRNHEEFQVLLIPLESKSPLPVSVRWLVSSLGLCGLLKSLWLLQLTHKRPFSHSQSRTSPKLLKKWQRAKVTVAWTKFKKAPDILCRCGINHRWSRGTPAGTCYLFLPDVDKLSMWGSY